MSTEQFVSDRVLAIDREADVVKRVNGARNVIHDLRQKPEYIHGNLDARDRNDLDVCMEILRRDGDAVTQPFLDNLHTRPAARALVYEPDPDLNQKLGTPSWVTRPKLV